MNNKYDIVFGDDCMGLYVNGELAVAATKLTFADVLENCGIRVDLWEVDLDYKEPEQLPKCLNDLVFPDGRSMAEQAEEQI